MLAGHSPEATLQTQHVWTLEAARTLAAEWLEDMRAKRAQGAIAERVTNPQTTLSVSGRIGFAASETLLPSEKRLAADQTQRRLEDLEPPAHRVPTN